MHAKGHSCVNTRARDVTHFTNRPNTDPFQGAKRTIRMCCVCERDSMCLLTTMVPVQSCGEDPPHINWLPGSLNILTH